MLLLSMFLQAAFAGSPASMQYLRGEKTRVLQEATPPITTSSIPLFLFLSFLDDDTVTRIEARDEELITVICGAVHEQVRFWRL
jgi:hypothetical protein